MALFFCSGPATQTLRRLRRSTALRRWRIQTRGRGECIHLILGIGQVHPVLSGRFEWFQARRIATVQADIFELCRYLVKHYRVSSFGQEGLSSDDSGPMRARMGDALLFEITHAIKDRGVRHYLRTVATRWRKALRKGDREVAAHATAALNGLSVLQAVDPKVTIFPIERRDLHGAIGEAIDTLSREIQKVEASTAFQSAQRKGGKGLTKQEYKAALTRHALIKQYNKTLSHPERDRAIQKEVLKHMGDRMTVFVLGQAHHTNQLTFAARTMPDGVLFVWLTPPGLWWWQALLWRIGWAISIILLLMLMLSVRIM